MLPYIETFERVIINTLLFLMACVVVLSTIELAWIIVLEPKELPEGAILGIATLVLGLTLGYYAMRLSRKESGDSDLESSK